MRIFTKLAAAELRLFLREPLLVFFTVAFPSVLIVILGSIPSFREPSADLGGLRVIDLYVPIAVALTLAMLAFQAMPTALATHRERGVLRRLATTPARPVALLAAQLVVTLLLTVLSVLLVLVIARIAFGVAWPRQVPAFLLSFLLAAAAVFGVGLFIAAVVPSGKVANSAGTLLFFPSMFFAGLWAPREVLPRVIQRIGDFTPLGAGERALHDATTGHWPATLSLTVLVAYAVVFGLGAARLFRWE